VERDRKITAADRHLLYFAAFAGYWDLLISALPHTKEVVAANRADVTPLMLAADAGHVEAVRALLAAGAKVNARSARRWPPLLEHNPLDDFPAALAGHSPAKPRLVGGYTALRAANEKGHTEVVHLLVAAGGKE
jgi:ankyrin repeat domain-containing protein 17